MVDEDEGDVKTGEGVVVAKATADHIVSGVEELARAGELLVGADAGRVSRRRLRIGHGLVLLGFGIARLCDLERLGDRIALVSVAQQCTDDRDANVVPDSPLSHTLSRSVSRTNCIPRFKLSTSRTSDIVVNQPEELVHYCYQFLFLLPTAQDAVCLNVV